jgi:hypothetical protein
MIRIFFKRLVCHHDYSRIKTIHGDRIIHMGYTRSIWKCCKCGKEVWSQHLDEIK